MRLFLSIVVALVCVVPVRAATVFTNFQSSSSFGCYVTGGVNMQACAAAVTPSANYTMTDAQIKVAAVDVAPLAAPPAPVIAKPAITNPVAMDLAASVHPV